MELLVGLDDDCVRGEAREDNVTRENEVLQIISDLDFVLTKRRDELIASGTCAIEHLRPLSYLVDHAPMREPLTSGAGSTPAGCSYG